MKFRPPFMVQTSLKHQEKPSEYFIYSPLLHIMTNRPPCRSNIYLIEVSLLLHILLSKYFVVKTLQLSLLNGDKCCSKMSTKSFVVYLTKCHIPQSAHTVHSQHRAQLLQLHLRLGRYIRGNVVADYSALSIHV